MWSLKKDTRNEFESAQETNGLVTKHPKNTEKTTSDHEQSMKTTATLVSKNSKVFKANLDISELTSFQAKVSIDETLELQEDSEEVSPEVVR